VDEDISAEGMLRGTPAKRPVRTPGKHCFVGQTNDGGHAVRAKGSKRASAILETQRDAIDRVKELNSDNRPAVERVRNTQAGVRNKWRPSE